MKWKEFEFITDENIHPKIVEFLREQGIAVFDIKEEKLNGTEDIILFELAKRKKSIFLTHDGDFGKISYINDMFLSGIVYLRPAHIKPHISIDSLKHIFNTIPLPSSYFIVVAKNNSTTIKIRYRDLSV